MSDDWDSWSHSSIGTFLCRRSHSDHGVAVGEVADRPREFENETGGQNSLRIRSEGSFSRWMIACGHLRKHCNNRRCRHMSRIKGQRLRS